MPREKLMANYLGENGEHLMGVPACDLYETQWNRLTDAQKADVDAAVFYRVRPAAADDVEAAAKHVEKAEPVNPMAEMPTPPEPKDAPKAEAKK